MWLEGFLGALSLNNIAWLFLGTLWGLFIGVLPALGPNFAVAIMLPFTYGMDTASALIFLCAIHASCNYGDSLASILINIPGGPGTVATCWDGYPMARQGKAMRALGIATFASFFGGAVTWFSLVLLAKPIGKMAFSIGAPEYFALGVMALSLVAVAARGETLKGLVMVCLGLLLGCVGVDPVTGVTSRFSFGILWLEAGIPIVVSTLGIFAISQIISLMEEKSINKDEGVIGLKGSILPGFMDVVRRPLTLLRAGFVGWFIGILPALGVSLAGILAYLVERKYSKEKEEFGKGAPGGLVAAEVGKGACVVGDLIPTFTLGIPGSVTGAILMAALIIHGIEPGPRFLISGPLPYVVFSGLLLGQLAYVIIGPVFCKVLARLIYLPNAILVPFITILTFVGAYCERNYAFDILLMVAFGMMAYALEKGGYSVVCIVLGLILEDIVEANLSRSLLIGFGSPAVFLERPIALVLFAITFLFLIGPFLLSYVRFRGLSLGEGSAETPEMRVHLSEVLSLLIMAGVMVTFLVMGRAYIEKVRLFPNSVAVAGLVFILFRLSSLALTALRSKDRSKIPTPEGEVKERPVVSWPVSMAILVGYAALVNLFGFVVTSGMFALVMPFVAGYRNPKGLIAMSAGAVILTLVFAKLLNVLLPVGVIYSALFY